MKLLYNSLLEGNKQWVRERLARRIQNLGFSICLVFATFLSTILNAQVYPPSFSQTRIANPISVPVAAALAPDGRFFAIEQTGRVRVIKNNVLLATPFVSLTVDSNGERGLLGIAVDPDFLINKYIYLYHTVPGTPARNRITRYTATNDTATPGSETVILNLDPLSSALIHNGGAIHFGKDGKLYVAVGENSNTAHSQNLDTYHGKLLRINKDGSAPADNPFPTGSEQRRRVWALGLRNPFTFAVDLETGKIFVNDVGGTAWEEINDATLPGRNFGWPNTEGRFNPASFPTLTNPVYAYAHGTGDGVGCAIVGGAFISPSNPHYPPEYRGKYVFQENCNAWFNILDLSGPTAVRSPFVTAVNRHSVGLMTDIDGYMYFLGRHDQGLFKIVYDGGIEPTITNHPANVRVVVGQPASFTVSAVGTPPLTYQWQKNNQNIPGATNATFLIAQCTEANSGQYRVIVSNAAGPATSNAATLSVVDNALPTANILTPTGLVPYVAGATISFSGEGTDPEDGQLPPAAMSWHIHFHHDVHHHDEPPRDGISSGEFTIPRIGETSANVWYRIHLEVTDSEGFTSEDSVDIFPLKSTLAFNTNPAGLQILLDGQPFNTPGSVLSVEGTIRTIGAPPSQTLGGDSYAFESWTHGGTQSQDITTPSADITYTANFREVESNFYRAINLNGPALTIDGNNWEASATAPGYSATNAFVFSNQNIPLVPATDAARATMIRSSVWGGNVTVSLGSMPAGSYTVFLYVWEDNESNTYTVRMEGQIVQANYVSGGAGQWSKLGPFVVNVADGALTVNAAGPAPNLSGLEIWTAGAAPPTAPTVTNPLVDQVATVGVPMNYTFAANSFSGSAPLTYSATLTNGNPLPGWLTFIPGTRTFSGTPAAGNLAIRVTATNSVSSISDDFTVTVNAAPVMPTLVQPLQDQSVNAGTSLTYVIPVGSFSGTSLVYTALLSNGSSLPPWLTFTPATRTFSGTPSALDVSPISVRVTVTNGGGSANDIFDITVNSTGAATFYRALNLNGPALVIDGNNWEASATAPGYSATNAQVFTNQNVPLVPATDATRATMIRSSVWGSNVTVSLGSMPAGSYTVYLYVWEDNGSTTYTVRMEGQIVQNNYVSGTAGQWSKLGPFAVNVADGALTVNASGGAASAANLSGLEIWTQGVLPPTAPTVTNPLVDQVATVGVPMNYTFAANSFSGSAPLTYAAALTNGNPLPLWLTFTPGTRAFSGTPGAGDVGGPAVRVTATNSVSSISDDFTVTVNAAPAMPTLVQPLQDQNVNAGTPLTYVIPATSFSGTGLVYTALLSNGSSLPPWLTFTAATRTFSGTPSALDVSPISVRVTVTNGGGSANDIFDITVNSTGAATFYRALNLNGPALVIDGNNWEASATAPGYSATNAFVFSNQAITLVPATDANRATMIRSSVWSSNVTVSLGSMPTGSYTVYLYVWEDNQSNTFTLRMEGQIVQSNIVSGGAGQWAKLGPFTVTVTDGALTVNATGPAPNMSGLEIWTPGGSGSGRMSFAESSSGVLPEEEPLVELTAYPNPFSTKVTIVYTAIQAGPTSLTLYDMRGLKIWSTPEKNVSIGHKEIVEIETSGFEYGVYVLELINGRSGRRQKVVKVN